MRVWFLAIIAILSLIAPAAADPLPEKLIVASWNVEWLFDNYSGDNSADLAKRQAAPSREAWDWKLAGVAKVIAEIKPTILALQEIENQRVLFYLTSRLRKEHGLDYEIAYIEGGDFFTEQDVGVLALSGLTEISMKRQTKEMYDTKAFYNLNKHIFCKFAWGSGDQKHELLLLNVHYRAQPAGGEIRTRQSRLARAWINDAIAAGQNVMVIGDVNSEENHSTVTQTGDIGTLRGLDTESTQDDLTDLWAFAKNPAEETHLVHKQFDRILVTPGMVKEKSDAPGLAFSSFVVRRDLVIRGKEQDKDHTDIFWQIPEDERDISDHYPIVAEFTVRP